MDHYGTPRLADLMTRLQSKDGLRVIFGTLRHSYSGLPATLVVSCPSAAIFFCTYESIKRSSTNESLSTFNIFVASSIAELCASIIRTPAEIIKQRRQAHLFTSTLSAFKDLIHKSYHNGNWRVAEFYRGFIPTIMRDIPFSVIQLIMYEENKRILSKALTRPISPWESSFCGCIAGGLAAAATTPLDVLKTRTMLTINVSKVITIDFHQAEASEGYMALFHGIIPRVLWITLGGGIFFGAYEYAQSFFIRHFE